MEKVMKQTAIIRAEKRVGLRLSRGVEEAAADLITKGFESTEIVRALVQKFGLTPVRAERTVQEAVLTFRLAG